MRRLGLPLGRLIDSSGMMLCSELPAPGMMEVSEAGDTRDASKLAPFRLSLGIGAWR